MKAGELLSIYDPTRRRGYATRSPDPLTGVALDTFRRDAKARLGREGLTLDAVDIAGPFDGHFVLTGFAPIKSTVAA